MPIEENWNIEPPISPNKRSSNRFLINPDEAEHPQANNSDLRSI
tara:strand:- start:87 stop:218 length:132 start_codon:yes stop_codon:yes gene_type:complete